MIIENKKFTFNIWLQKFVATVIFVPIVLTISFTRFFEKLFPGMEKVHFFLIAGGLYLGLMFYHFFLKPNYIYFTDNGSKIILRYYLISAFNRKKHSIEIPKDKFVKFETMSSFPGKEKIVLSLQVKQQIASYPPVSLSALKKDEVEKIKKVLSSYSKTNSKNS